MPSRTACSPLNETENQHKELQMMSEVIFYSFHDCFRHFRHTFAEHFPQIASLLVQHISVVLLRHLEVERVLRFFEGGSCSLSASSSFWLFGDVPQCSSASRRMCSRRLILDLHVFLCSTQLLIIARLITMYKTRAGHLRLAAFTEYYLAHLINDIHSYFGFVGFVVSGFFLVLFSDETSTSG